MDVIFTDDFKAHVVFDNNGSMDSVIIPADSTIKEMVEAVNMKLKTTK